ncbi:MAG: uroporphyrinogen decarboxylase family protein [Anaerolineae bacterium]|jgi:uroporphyrinogen decarboxylase
MMTPSQISLERAVGDPASLRAYLEAHYGLPENDSLSPWQRVETALAHRQPDRVPFDFWAVPEVWEKLRAALDLPATEEGDEELLRLLGIDCRMVTARYVGTKARALADGTYIDAWGTHRRQVRNEFSSYGEYASHPLADAETVADVEGWDWPTTDDWDVSGVGEQCERLNKDRRHHLRYEVGGIFEWSWALRGFERFLVDLVEKPDVACAIMDRFTDIYIENTVRVIQAAGGMLDMVYTYDDVGMQNGLLISPRMWGKYILPRHQRLNAAIRSAAYEVKIMYHSCGAIYPLIGAFIDEMGIDVLNPLQPRAAGMEMDRIKAAFGSRISFHGGIDIQQTLPHGTPAQVQAEVRERCRVLGRGGGYICTSAHHIQADTPLENIVALYTAPRKVP